LQQHRPARRGESLALWYMMALLALAIIVSYLDRGVIAVLVPSLKRDFGLSDVDVSLVQGIAFSLPFALASLPVGRFVDHYSRRNIIVAGIVVWSLATMLCGTSASYWQLFAARAGIGIGEACLQPAAYSMIADSFRAERRGRAMSMLTVATSIGGGASALLGGALLTLWSGSETVVLPLAGEVATWRAVFLVVGLPGFVVALLMLFVREPARQAQSTTAPAAPRTGDFAGHLRRNWRLFVPLYLAFSMVFFFSYAVGLWSPTVLARTYGYSAGSAGMTAGSFQLVGSISGALLAGVFGDIMIARDARYGRLRVWMYGLLPALVAGVFLALPGARFYVVGIGLAIFASGLLTAASFATLYDAVPPNMRGRSLAVYLFLGNVLGFGGGTFGVALITEHVLSDPRQINYAVAMAVGGASLVATVMGFAMRGRYEDARLTYQQDNAGATTAAGNRS